MNPKAGGFLEVKSKEDTHPTSRPSGTRGPNLDIRTKLQFQLEGTFRTSSDDDGILLKTDLEFQKV